MSRKLYLSLLVYSSLLLPLLSCRGIKVKIGQSSPSSLDSIDENRPLSQTQLYQTWNSMEDNVDRLEELKNLGAKAFLERYKNQGRALLRSGFRQFRDSVSRNALTEHNYSQSFYGSLHPGQCKTISSAQDVFEMSDYGDLRPILQAAILAKLEANEARILHPTLPASLDTVTKLVFFELGIKIDGTSHYAVTDTTAKLSADLVSQLIHERNEPESWQDQDQRSWRLSMQHQKSQDNKQHLSFEAQVGLGLYENAAQGPRDFLRFNFNQSAQEQSLELQNGKMNAGKTEFLVYSRRIALYKLSSGPDQFRLIDTTRYQLAGSKTRSFTLNKAKGEICAESDDKSTGEKPTIPGNNSNPEPKPQLPDNPSQNPSKDDPTQNGK